MEGHVWSYATVQTKHKSTTDAPQGASKVHDSDYICSEGKRLNTRVSRDTDFTLDTTATSCTISLGDKELFLLGFFCPNHMIKTALQAAPLTRVFSSTFLGAGVAVGVEVEEWRLRACYFWCKCSTSAEQQARSESSESCHRKQITRAASCLAKQTQRRTEWWRAVVEKRQSSHKERDICRAGASEDVWQKPRLTRADCRVERMLNPRMEGGPGTNRQNKGETNCEKWMWRCSRGAPLGQISGGQGSAFSVRPSNHLTSPRMCSHRTRRKLAAHKDQPSIDIGVKMDSLKTNISSLISVFKGALVTTTVCKIQWQTGFYAVASNILVRRVCTYLCASFSRLLPS